MTRHKNGTFIWSVIYPEFKFDQSSNFISSHSLVTIPSYDINHEYVLLIGGVTDRWKVLKDVFKFNGTWSAFGQLNKPRWNHNSIYWNGAVYVIGGEHNRTIAETKTEIWKINNSLDQFKSVEKMPTLTSWNAPNLFVVSDSFFPNK